MTDYISVTNNKGHKSENAKDFFRLFDILRNYGIAHIDHYSNFSFWSGSVARKFAYDSPDITIDSNVPTIAIMYDLVGVLRNTEHSHCSKYLGGMISCFIATHCKDDVNVYLSHPKLSEAVGFTAANYFWEFELPVLQKLRQNKIVSDIILNIYDHNKNCWQEPFSIDSPKANSVPIHRRTPHCQLDALSDHPKYKKSNMTAEEHAEWNLSEPRGSITLGKLKAISRRWYSIAKQNATNRDKIAFFEQFEANQLNCETIISNENNMITTMPNFPPGAM